MNTQTQLAFHPATRTWWATAPCGSLVQITEYNKKAEPGKPHFGDGEIKYFVDAHIPGVYDWERVGGPYPTFAAAVTIANKLASKPIVKSTSNDARKYGNAAGGYRNPLGEAK